MSTAPAAVPFRCSAASLDRGDAPAGTASTVRAFLLLEHPGPWGVEALRDARLPDGLGAELLARCRAARVRPLLVRRPAGRRDGGTRVIAASCLPSGTRLESAVLDDPRDVVDLDLVALRAGRGAGLPSLEGPVLAVCTHGRHDACCAELGRPVAAALAARLPEATWEVSHIGGDRYAGNLLVLPDGLYYGRLDPASAVTVVGALLEGHLELDHLRGRSAYPMPVQAAEVALRREIGETRRDAVGWTGQVVDGPVTTATFVAGGSAWTVQVRTELGPPARLTCRAARADGVPRHVVEAVRRAGDAADA